MVEREAAHIVWARRVMAEHGEVREDGSVTIGMSQAQLAKEAGLSPGTVQKHVARLAASGALVKRTPLTFARTELPATPRPPRADDDMGRDLVGVVARLGALVDQRAHDPVVVSTAVATLDLLTRMSATSTRAQYQRTRALSRADQGARATEGADSADSEQTDQTEDHVNGGLLSVFPTAPRETQGARGGAGGAASASAAGRPSARQGGRDWGDAEFAQWCAQLDRAAGGCPGVKEPYNLDGVRQALSSAQLTSAEISQGVSQIVRNLRDGKAIRSPYGLLAAAARGGPSSSLWAEHFATPPPAQLSAPAGKWTWRLDAAGNAVERVPEQTTPPNAT